MNQSAISTIAVKALHSKENPNPGSNALDKASNKITCYCANVYDNLLQDNVVRRMK